MCGIVGVYSQNKHRYQNEMKLALQQLNHRGPDSQTIWHSQNHPIALGHTRLSIIDVEHGNQPVFNASKKIHAVVNGEFYDYKKIRSELMAEGFSFSTNSDSEILVNLYEKYGVKCLEHLRGEFAFILWDEQKKLLFAGRDRFGIKPIFYFQADNGDIYFSSEAKGIFPFGIAKEWDEESFYDSLFLRVPLQNRSFIKGIKQIPPGHYLLITENSKVNVHKYWDFNYPDEILEANNSFNEKSLIEEFREKLIEAIELRLMADVPVAFYLSGGIDSSVILSVAAQICDRPLEAFTLLFEHGDYDEYAYAKDTAGKLGVKINTLEVTENDLVDNFSKAIWHSENFFNNGNGISKFLLSHHVQKAGYKVILTGEGSDEILGGYVHFRKDVIERELSNDQGLINNIIKNNQVSLGFFLSTFKSASANALAPILGFVPSWINNHACSGDQYSQLLKSSFLDKYKQHDPYINYIKQIDFAKQLHGKSTLSKSLYTWSKQILPNYILSVLGDRMEMAHSIEGRVPFLDHVFVEFAAKLPDTLKIKNNVEKYILREAFKDILTPAIYARQKHSFLSPPALLSEKGPLFSFIQDTLRSKNMLNVPFLEHKQLINQLNKINSLSITEKISFDPLLMFLTSICIFQEKFIT